MGVIAASELSVGASGPGMAVGERDGIARPDTAATLGDIERLYREHFEFVWRNARRLGCSDAWVDDAVHETFLVATRRLVDFEGRSSARTWLFSILFRVVQRSQRDHARQRKHIARYERERPPLNADREQETQSADYLRHLLLQLPEPQRAIVILSELEGFTSVEIAESLSVPRGTIDSRLRAARLLLKRAIERDRKRERKLDEGSFP
jgi:RNA polymerase sigma-70 factor, ECF subfamily